MKMTIKNLILGVAVLGLAAPLYAVDPIDGEGGDVQLLEPGGEGEEAVRLVPPVRLIDDAVTGLELQPEQQQQYQQIFKQHAPKIQKHFQQQQQIFTPEQKAKRREVIKKGREEGKQGQELQQYVQSQVPLTPQQQKQYTDCETEIKKCQTQFQTDVEKILTPQQQELLPPVGGKWKGKGKGKRPPNPGKQGPPPTPGKQGPPPTPGKEPLKTQ